MNTPADLRKRAEEDLATSRRILQLMEDGDAIVGSTPRSRAQRVELATRIATLERLLSAEKKVAA